MGAWLKKHKAKIGGGVALVGAYLAGSGDLTATLKALIDLIVK